MATFYLIRGDQIISTIDGGVGASIAVPLFAGGDAMSLLNKAHSDNLMSNLSLTPAEALEALGVADLTDSMLTAVAVGPDPRTTGAAVTAKRLLSIDGYYLWMVVGQRDDLLAMHATMWVRSPLETLGLLAVVQTPGEVLYQSAVRTATGMSVAQALARKNRIADFLESLGHTETATLRTATTEHDQVIGIAAALGFTEEEFWSAMAG